MKNKKRLLSTALALMLCLCGMAMPAYAQSNEPQTTAATPAPTPEATPTTPNPFSTDGTGTVVDTATDSDSKEFYVITTPDENVFYLVIDNQKENQNVYFLNAVTESDLLALAEKDDAGTTLLPTTEPTPEPTAEPEVTEPVQEEPAPTKSGNSGLLLVVLVLAGAVGLAGYYFKIYKPKHEMDDAEDIDEFEFDGPEEPTVNEDEENTPQLTDEEEAEQRRLYEEQQVDSSTGESDDDPVF